MQSADPRGMLSPRGGVRAATRCASMDRKPSEQPSAQPSLVRASLTAAATEPLQATLLRTVPIALIIGTVASLLLRGMPQGANDWRGWLSRVAAALWLTFGGHYIELLYLRGVLPRVIAEQGSENVSRWFVRLGARCAVWALGGAALWIGGVSTLPVDHGRKAASGGGASGDRAAGSPGVHHHRVAGRPCRPDDPGPPKCVAASRRPLGVSVAGGNVVAAAIKVVP